MASWGSYHLCGFGLRPWQRAAPKYCGNDMYVKYPAVKAWMNRMKARPLVKKVFEDQEQAIKEEKM